MFLVTNYRIFLTRRTSCHAENHGWSRMSVMNFLFYHELSNYRIVSSHGVSRRSRIIELILSITRRVAEVTNYRIIEFSSHGISRKVTNYRIIEFSSHGVSRKVTGFYHELSDLYFQSHGESRKVTELFFLSRDLSFGPTDQREVIIGLSNCLFTRKIMCISWVSQTSIRR